LRHSLVLLVVLTACVGYAPPAPGASPSSAFWRAVPLLPSVGSTGVFDPVRHRMILVPDQIGGSDPPDLWTLDTRAPDRWVVLHTYGASPPWRKGRAAVYDPGRDRLLLYGGTDFSSPDSSDHDVWALSLDGPPTWSRLSAPGPAPLDRYSPSLVYDAARDRLLLFGGGHFVNGQGTRPLADVWTFALSGAPDWTSLVPTTTGPTGRLSAAAIYDPVRDRLVIHGGRDSIGLWSGAGPRSDAWALPLSGPATWTRIFAGSPPSECYGRHVGIYDPVRDRMLLVGGEDSTWYPRGYHAEVRALSLDSPAMLDLVLAAGSGPGGREDMACVYDPVLDAVFSQGGDADYAGSSDTWRLDLAGGPRWSLVLAADVVPHARFGQAQAYDALRHRTVFYGGRYTYYVSYSYPTTYYDDLWGLALGDHPTWTPLDPAGSRPPTRQYATLTADPQADRMWLFGGDLTVGISGPVPSRATEAVIGSPGTPKYYGDLWRLDLAGTAWTSIVPSGPGPGPRDGHSAVLDAGRHRLLLYGGRDSLGPKGDLWSLSLDDPPQWTPLVPLGTPPAARAFHVAAYDAAADLMIVTCGRGAGDVALTDTWALSLADPPSWTPLPTAGIAPLTTGPRPGVFDAANRCILVIGDDATAGSGQTALHVLNLEGDPAWSTLAAITTPRPDAYGRSVSYDPPSGWYVVLWGTNGSRGESVEGLATQLALDQPVAVPGRAPAAPRFTLSAPSPNPVRDLARVSATLADGGAARVELFDLQGRRLARRDLDPHAVGAQEVRFDTRALRAGLYFIRLEQGRHSAVVKACVVR
jgi:hypothetical protein